MATERPNILLLMTDQQRGDCLGVDGHPCLMTPSMDALAGEGIRFERGYSTCPACIPARRSLMSGLHPQTHGMVAFVEGQAWDYPATLPQLLRDGGYQTGLVGRTMHLFPARKRYGFEEMTYAKGSQESDYTEYVDRQAPEAGGAYSGGVMNNDWTARPWHLPEQLHHTHWTVNEALRFLRRRDPSRPWFLAVTFQAPHPPLIPPDFYFQRYLRAELPEPAVGDWEDRPVFAGGAPLVNSNRVDLRGEALRSCQAGYFGLINHVDDQIRRLLAAEAGMVDLRNTLVVFTSDHGEMLGDHYFFRKGMPYEGAARSPFILRPPGNWAQAARGQSSALPVCLEDLMPTLLEAGGVAVPQGLDGRSLLPILRGQEGGPWREALHLEYAGTGAYPFHALTDGREKYIWFSQSGREQLFDLRSDPHELHDLAQSSSNGARVAEWRGRLIKAIEGRQEGFVQEGKLVAGRGHPGMTAARV
jgi:arylsulfatase A-like enzyme